MVFNLKGLSAFYFLRFQFVKLRNRIFSHNFKIPILIECSVYITEQSSEKVNRRKNIDFHTNQTIKSHLFYDFIMCSMFINPTILVYHVDIAHFTILYLLINQLQHLFLSFNYYSIPQLVYIYISYVLTIFFFSSYNT